MLVMQVLLRSTAAERTGGTFAIMSESTRPLDTAHAFPCIFRMRACLKCFVAMMARTLVAAAASALLQSSSLCADGAQWLFRHFIATLQRYKLHPEQKHDWSLPSQKLERLEEVCACMKGCVRTGGRAWLCCSHIHSHNYGSVEEKYLVVVYVQRRHSFIEYLASQ